MRTGGAYANTGPERVRSGNDLQRRRPRVSPHAPEPIQTLFSSCTTYGPNDTGYSACLRTHRDYLFRLNGKPHCPSDTRCGTFVSVFPSIRKQAGKCACFFLFRNTSDSICRICESYFPLSPQKQRNMTSIEHTIFHPFAAPASAQASIIRMLHRARTAHSLFGVTDDPHIDRIA